MDKYINRYVLYMYECIFLGNLKMLGVRTIMNVWKKDRFSQTILPNGRLWI